MNPYDFVRINSQQRVNRRPVTSHDRFGEGFSGRVEGTITTLTPLFIPQTEDLQHKTSLLRSNRPITFARNASGRYIKPGSSLKGLFRSVAETIGPGCWWLFPGQYDYDRRVRRYKVDYRSKLPGDFKPCPHQDRFGQNILCPACRLFGLIKGQTLLLGKVGFGDAECAEPIDHPGLYTPVLDVPKPRHRAWYLDEKQQQVAGRKFYFHFTKMLQTNRLIPTHGGDHYLNSYIKPVGINSRFTFSAHFDNVTSDEWPVLLYALTLERKDWGHDHDVRHKIGYAKPAGLGSIEVQLSKLTLVNYRERYTTPNKGIDLYESEALKNYVNDWIRQPFLKRNTVTLQDLRQIWAWPPDDSVTYCYPKRAWFDQPENRDAPISATRDAPCQ